MKNSQKWLASVLLTALTSTTALAGVAGAASPASAQAGASSSDAKIQLSDTESHWAKGDIEKWVMNGVLNGYPDGTFHPNQEITRAEFVKVLNKVFGFYAPSDKSFADVSASNWYAESLSVAREAGYYEGFPGNKAMADTNITRQDAVTLLARVFALTGGSAAASSFKDDAQINGYAHDAVNALATVLSGYPDGTFRPAGSITRAEVVTLINKLVEGYYSAAGNFESGQVAGNVVVNHEGVVLKNAVIKGNLYLAAGIGNGEVKLDGVTVTGKTYIAGGGANTIILNDSTLGEVHVNRKEGQVRVSLTGHTRASQITVDSPSKLEAESGAEISSVILNQPVALVVNEGATIANLEVASGAGSTTIAGKGSITTAVIAASGVTLNGQALSQGTTSVAGGIAAGTPGSGTGSGSGPGSVTPSQTVNLVDRQATAATRSLFSYLNEIRGTNILFGQQHATTEGLSIAKKDGTQSDAKNAVGEYPALFGWDTLSLEGKEKPGDTAKTFEVNRDALVDVMKKAYEDGGVLTLSSHMPNFVTGSDFYDTKGNVVSHILPGGDKNEDYNKFLDNIADFANHLKDNNGNLIPVIFRPFHEQNGSWFWWGAAFTTTDEYKEIYRYTVEYLRDKQGVRNFLYAFSPGGGYGSSEEQYLKTYPGDDYVDILGFDSYYNGEGEGWFNSVVTEAKTLSKLADKKNKVAAMTEFGYQKMQVSGNATPDFYTRLANALKSDPDSIRMAFMLTWANFGPDSVYVPYPTASGPQHEMLPDFIKFFNDSYSLFSNGVIGAYNRNVATDSEQPFMHIASPTDQGTIRTNTTKIRVRVLNEKPAKVVYTVGDSTVESPMMLDTNSGYYTADWSPDARLNAKTTTLTVKVYGADNTVLQEQTNTVFLKISETQIGAYTFDNDIEGIQNNGGYQAKVDAIEHASFNGSGALKLSVSSAVYTDTWQEMKLELKNAKSVAGSVYLTDVTRLKFDAWVPVSATTKSGNASLRAVVQLPPDWDNKYGMETTQVSVKDLETVNIDGVDYFHFSPTIDMTDTIKLKAADDIALSIVGSGLDSNLSQFPVFVDNIRMFSTYKETSLDPAVVDDFEGYLGSDQALDSKFVHAGGDATSTALDNANKHGGTYGLKYTYTLDSNGYAGITKSLGGVDWSGFNALQFWYKPDGKGQKLVMQINASGKTYEYYPDTTTDEAKFITASFSDFAPANGATGTLTKTNLKNVQAFSIYTNAKPNGTKLTSSMYFDDIKAVTDPNSGTVPNGSAGGGVAKGTLFAFDSSVQSWGLNDDQLGADNVRQTKDGSLDVLAADFPSSGGAGKHVEITSMSDKDLSNGNTLKIKARVAAGTVKATIFVKSGDWKWAAASAVDLGTEYQWLTLDLNGLDIDKNKIDKTLIKAMGIQIMDPNGTGKMTIYIDEVVLE